MVQPANNPVLGTICHGEPEHLSQTAADGRAQAKEGCGPARGGLLQGAQGLSPRQCQLFVSKPVPLRRGCDEILAVWLLPHGKGGRNATVPASPVPGMTAACHGG